MLDKKHNHGWPADIKGAVEIVTPVDEQRAELEGALKKINAAKEDLQGIQLAIGEHGSGEGYAHKTIDGVVADYVNDSVTYCAGDKLCGQRAALVGVLEVAEPGVQAATANALNSSIPIDTLSGALHIAQRGGY